METLHCSQTRQENNLDQDLSDLAQVLMQHEEAILWTDLAGRILGLNPTAATLLGIPEGLKRRELRQQNILSYFVTRTGKPDGERIKQLMLRRGKISKEQAYLLTRAERKAIRLKVWPHIGRRTQETVAIVGCLSDVSDLVYLAFHDDLTRTLNFRALKSALRQEVRDALTEQRPFGLVMVDTDGFKAKNDYFGQEAGDVLLHGVAAVLMRVTRPEYVARRGGDEFEVFVRGLPEDVERTAQAILYALRAAAFRYDDTVSGRTEQLSVTASIGWATLGDVLATQKANLDDIPFLVRTLLRYADLAMKQAKREEKDCVRHFQPSLLERLR